LPVPEPGPRPTRFLPLLLPSAGESSESFMA
jgi:hypothetical protein